jgi:hypothetical protein
VSKEIKQVKVIHMAFEDKAKHIATYVPENGFQNVKDMLEDVYKFTQNRDDSWSNPEAKDPEGNHYDGSENLTMIASLENNPKNENGVYMGHRSTSVGDRMSVCYENNKGNGFYEKIFRVDDVGFSLCMTKNHVDGKKNAYEEALKSDPLLLAEQRMLLNQQMENN